MVTSAIATPESNVIAIDIGKLLHKCARPGCNETVASTRQTCSTRCRVAMHRAKKKAKCNGVTAKKADVTPAVPADPFENYDLSPESKANLAKMGNLGRVL